MPQRWRGRCDEGLPIRTNCVKESVGFTVSGVYFVLVRHRTVIFVKGIDWLGGFGNGTILCLHGGRTEWNSSIRGPISWLLNALEVGDYCMYHKV